MIYIYIISNNIIIFKNDNNDNNNNNNNKNKNNKLLQNCSPRIYLILPKIS